MNLLHQPRTFTIGDGSITVLLPRELTEGRLELFDFVVPPGHPGPGMHVHKHSDELFNLRAGEARFEIDGELIIASAGDTVIAPRGSAHNWHNSGDATLRMLITFSPAAGMASYFEELVREMTACGGGFPAPAVMRELWSRYDTAPA